MVEGWVFFSSFKQEIIMSYSILYTYTLTTQVIANVVTTVMISYAKMVHLHSYHGNQDTALLMGGMVTKVGSLAGAVLFFFIANSPILSVNHHHNDFLKSSKSPKLI